jgi:hypothetical protein
MFVVLVVYGIANRDNFTLARSTAIFPKLKPSELLPNFEFQVWINSHGLSYPLSYPANAAQAFVGLDFDHPFLGAENDGSRAAPARKGEPYGESRLSSFGRTFDYLLAQSVFTHSSKAQIVQCMTEASKVMTPRSVFVATYLRGDTDYDGHEWVYPDCVPYRESSMQSMAADCGLTCVPYTYPHPAGVSWVLLFATRQQGVERV